MVFVAFFAVVVVVGAAAFGPPSSLPMYELLSVQGPSGVGLSGYNQRAPALHVVPNVTAVLSTNTGAVTAYDLASPSTRGVEAWSRSAGGAAGVASVASHVGALDAGVGVEPVPGAVDVLTLQGCVLMGLASTAATGTASNTSRWLHTLGNLCDAAIPLLSDDGSHALALTPLQFVVLDASNGSLACKLTTAQLGAPSDGTVVSLTASREGRFAALALANTTHTWVRVVDTVLCSAKGPHVVVPQRTPATICPMGVFLIHGTSPSVATVRRWAPDSGAYAPVLSVGAPSLQQGRLVAVTISVNGEDKNVDGCWAALAFCDGTTAEVTTVNMLSGKRYFNLSASATAVSLVSQLEYLGVATDGSTAAAVCSLYSATPLVQFKANPSPSLRVASLVVDAARQPPLWAGDALHDTVYFGYAGDEVARVVSFQNPTHV